VGLELENVRGRIVSFKHRQGLQHLGLVILEGKGTCKIERVWTERRWVLLGRNRESMAVIDDWVGVMGMVILEACILNHAQACK
jgi:NADH:ubiquinone oxidoreductase subunit